MRTIFLLALALPMVAQTWGNARAIQGVGVDPSLRTNCTDTQVLTYDAVSMRFRCAAGGTGLADPGSSGLVVRNGANSSVARALAVGTPGCLTITNGNGVSGNPAISIDPACITLFSISTGLPSTLSDFATAGPGERLHLKTDTGQAWLSFANSDFRQLILAASNGAMNVPSNAGDVSGPANGQCWYDSTGNKFRCRENGTSKDMISAGGGSSTIGSLTTVASYDAPSGNYPGGLLTSATTTLNGAINNSQTSITLNTITWVRTTGPRMIKVGTEVILCGAVTSTSCTSATRGYAGSTAASASDAAAVTEILAYGFNLASATSVAYDNTNKIVSIVTPRNMASVAVGFALPVSTSSDWGVTFSGGCNSEYSGSSNQAHCQYGYLAGTAPYGGVNTTVTYTQGHFAAEGVNQRGATLAGRWTNTGTFFELDDQTNWPGYQALDMSKWWFRLSKSGSNRVSTTSPNGVVFGNPITAGYTAGITANRVYFAVFHSNQATNISGALTLYGITIE